MMLIFWGGIGLMLLIAIAIIIIPLAQIKHETEIIPQQKNIAGYQQSEQNFLEEAREPIWQVSTIDKPSWGLIIIVVVLLPIFALSLYLHLGASAGLKKSIHTQAALQTIQAKLKNAQSPDDYIILLKNKLQQSPRDAKAWFLLGRLYFDVKNYQAAVDAFQKADQYNPGNVHIMTQYAQALFFHQSKNLGSHGTALVQAVLRQEPYYAEAINLLALDAFVKGHYTAAINYWQPLLKTFTKDSDDRQAVLKAIALAKQKLAQQNKLHQLSE